MESCFFLLKHHRLLSRTTAPKKQKSVDNTYQPAWREPKLYCSWFLTTDKWGAIIQDVYSILLSHTGNILTPVHSLVSEFRTLYLPEYSSLLTYTFRNILTQIALFDMESSYGAS